MAGKKASLLVLSEANVTNVLNKLSTEEILSTVGRALRTLSVQDDSSTQGNSDVLQTPAIQNPLRITTSTPNHNLLYMPSRLGTSSTTSIKVVSVPRHPDDQTGLPATTLIFDEKTGQSKAVLNARSLTAVRTAAASALALSTSKHTKSARTLLIYGAGLQAYWHARLVSSLSKDLNQVTIASRRMTPRSEALAHDLTSFFHERAINVSSCSFEEAAKEGGWASLADIICCCTPSTVPLFPSERLKKDAGVTLIGSYKPHMQEIDLVPLAQEGRLKSVIVDSREACISEAGEIQRLLKALSISGQVEAKWLPELGQLVNERGAPADESAEDLTIFKSVGVGVMDSAISALVLQKAEELSEYTEVPF